MREKGKRGGDRGWGVGEEDEKVIERGGGGGGGEGGGGCEKISSRDELLDTIQTENVKQTYIIM